MKTLIYFLEDNLKPIGGPAGYLYNLKYQRDFEGDSEIEFINDNIMKKNLLINMSELFVKVSGKILYPGINMRYIYQLMKKSEHHSKIMFDKYDVIHFHGTLDMFSERRQLDNYKGKVILTSHSPKVFHREYIEDYLNEKEYQNNKEFLDKLEAVDKYAFERADNIIFPCEYAEEPYYHTWDDYSKIRQDKKIKYLPTGIKRQAYKKNAKDIRKELNIPEDAFVLSFVGRHNEVKGYDLLIEIFNKLPNVYVISCGKQENINAPKSSRWIEVGWTDDPYSYVNASDVYMLPNRETYFDLALLQTLSIGKTAIISNTGGNKLFAHNENNAIYLYNNIEEAISLIKNICEQNSREKVLRENAQLEYFEKNYSVKVFYDNYKKILREITL